MRCAVVVLPSRVHRTLLYRYKFSGTVILSLHHKEHCQHSLHAVLNEEQLADEAQPQLYHLHSRRGGPQEPQLDARAASAQGKSS